MSKISEIINDPTLTYHQQLLAMARVAENEDTTLPVEDAFLEALHKGELCDLGEGAAPYRPRYIVPDYKVLFENGSKFLGLEKPTNIWEATNSLLILYKHVPSITSFPVYLGNLGDLLEPFYTTEQEVRQALKLFLLHIDKTLTDSFVHANIGPRDTKIARVLLDLTEEMQLAIPNLTLLYDPELTSDEFALACIKCMLATSKPSFANHRMYAADNPHEYGIVSCYNALRVGGGGYTLPRIRLYEVSKNATSVEDFMDNVLPKYVGILLRNIDSRIRYIVEETGFFENNFLVKEGFIERENFTGMVGVVGLAECVNNLLGIKDKGLGYGHSKEAEELAVRVLDEINALVQEHEGLYCSGCNNTYVMHAQVGIDTDAQDNSPGARIPIGYEPELSEHLIFEGKMHKHFVSGIGDIFKFDDTWNNTHEALLHIIQGSFDSGMRYFTGYNADNDVVRVTGYLVKKSELEKLDQNQQSLNNVSVFGKGARDGAKALSRRVYDESASK